MEEGIVQFYVGLILALGSTLMSFLDFGVQTVRITLLILGIILIATSKYRILK